MLINRYQERFAAALSLFDFCEPDKESLYEEILNSSDRSDAKTQKLETQIRTLTAWQGIGARDAAASINHVRHVLTRIHFKECPTLGSLVDQQQLRRARRLFDSHFPMATDTRNAVSHSSDMLTKAQYTERLYVIDSTVSGEDLNTPSGDAVVIDTLVGRHLTTTQDADDGPRLVTIELSDQTLDKLNSVIDMAVAAFKAVTVPRFGE